MEEESETVDDALVIGAGSAIGQALLQQLLADEKHARVWGVCRDAARLDASLADALGTQLLETDHGEADLARCVKHLREAGCRPNLVCICLGTLHDDAVQPEKRIEDFQPEQSAQVFHVNALLPMAWLRSLLPVTRHQSTCRVVVFSARVGSISDNRLGGWYTYRASKAALNMMLKTAAIELRRRAANVKLIAFHPGTTDTPLSAPFQANVPEGKLFSPAFVAEQLLTVAGGQEADGELSYLDWQGKTIPW